MSGIGDLQLFEYEASYWSRGDRLHLTFDAEDSAELAECLEPLGCEWLAKEILATEETAAAVTLEGVPASYDLFGTIVTFTFAEDEGLEHLTALHLAAADGIEAKLLGLPAARRVGRRRSDSDRENPAAITRATPRKKRRSPPEYLWEVADGATRVRSPRSPRMSMPIAKDASREGACRDGALVRVTPTTALLANGEFGMAAGRLTIVPIDPAAVARVQRWKDALAHGGIDVAPSAEVLARDELLEAFHDPSRDLERGLEERFRTKVLAYPRVGWASLGAMTRGALAVLRDAKLPCTERVHLWVAEALARGGSTYADDESELAERARRLFRNGLARGRDARAVVEMVVSGVPSFVLVREDRARALIDR